MPGQKIKTARGGKLMAYSSSCLASRESSLILSVSSSSVICSVFILFFLLLDSCQAIDGQISFPPRTTAIDTIFTHQRKELTQSNDLIAIDLKTLNPLFANKFHLAYLSFLHIYYNTSSPICQYLNCK